MFQGKFSIFGLCKDFLENNCQIKSYNKEDFKVKLIKDENGCYNISDNLFSIKCIFDENCLKTFSGANEKINLNQLNSKLYLIFHIFLYKKFSC
jgi:hypothetical protein